MHGGVRTIIFADDAPLLAALTIYTERADRHSKARFGHQRFTISHPRSDARSRRHEGSLIFVGEMLGRNLIKKVVGGRRNEMKRERAHTTQFIDSVNADSKCDTVAMPDINKR